MPVPDRRLALTEESIPNLKQLLMLGRPAAQGDQVMSVIEEAKQVLMDRLKRNLMMH
jgi:hypothetical protein